MMKGVTGQQNSCKTLIGVHEMHTSVNMRVGMCMKYTVCVCTQVLEYMVIYVCALAKSIATERMISKILDVIYFKLPWM